MASPSSYAPAKSFLSRAKYTSSLEKSRFMAPPIPFVVGALFTKVIFLFSHETHEEPKEATICSSFIFGLLLLLLLCDHRTEPELERACQTRHNL